MTREKIKSEVVNLIQESTYQTELNLLAFIDELCDDFESKTCENCKLLVDGSCTLGIRHFEIDTNPEDFGCNKFEKKEK